MSFCALPRAKSWQFHSPVSPDPLNARSLRSLGFPKSPALKNPRSANVEGHSRPSTCKPLSLYKLGLLCATSYNAYSVVGMIDKVDRRRVLLTTPSNLPWWRNFLSQMSGGHLSGGDVRLPWRHGDRLSRLSTRPRCLRDSGHTKKLVKSHCHTDARQDATRCSFSLRVINRWNSLSQEIVDALSVNAFKRLLESLRQKKMG